MFQAIAAALGLAGSLDKSATAQYLQGRQEGEADLNYSRSKDLFIWGDTSKQNLFLILFALLIVSAIVFILIKK